MFIETEEQTAILVVDTDTSLQQQLDSIYNGSVNNHTVYQIQACSSCACAIDHLQTSINTDVPYQLVFLESQLPDGDGLQLITEVWRLDPNIQIVLCTADTRLDWQQITDIVGESDQLLILQKPFSILELRQIVNALLRKWQLSKQSQNVMKFMEEQIRQRTQAIEEANRNLMQSEKLAAVGQLAAGIAHEINTPAQYVSDNINAIRDFFSTITRMLDAYRTLLNQVGQPELMHAITDQERKEDLAFILEDAPVAIEQSLEGMSQIVQIVQAMKGFSHQGQSPKASINLNLALENTLLVARNSYKYIADVDTQFADLPNIECYAGELNQVFLNIIVNAAHAIEDSGKSRGLITITTAADQGYVEIRIKDTGCGIPESIRERIFDPFFTTKDVGRGTGQGLNIAYRIIKQQHGGELNFESEPGVGTTFIIRLPKHVK